MALWRYETDASFAKSASIWRQRRHSALPRYGKSRPRLGSAGATASANTPSPTGTTNY